MRNSIDFNDSNPAVQEQRPALDKEALATLKDLGGDEDPEFLVSIVEQFIQDTRGYVESIRGAAASGDASVLERSAHTLKSSSASVGALVMSELCQTLQEMGRKGTVDGSEILAERLQGEFDRVRQALDHEVSKIKGTGKANDQVEAG